MRARAEQPMSQRKVLLTLGILLRLPTSWTAGVNTWGTQLISKPVKNPTRVKRPCTIQKANGRFLIIPTKPSGRRRLPMQQGSQGRRGADPQRWEKWVCSGRTEQVLRPCVLCRLRLHYVPMQGNQFPARSGILSVFRLSEKPWCMWADTFYPNCYPGRIGSAKSARDRFLRITAQRRFCEDGHGCGYAPT